jgi:hypothetical protein
VRQGVIVNASHGWNETKPVPPNVFENDFYPLVNCLMSLYLFDSLLSHQSYFILSSLSFKFKFTIFSPSLPIYILFYTHLKWNSNHYLSSTFSVFILSFSPHSKLLFFLIAWLCCAGKIKDIFLYLTNNKKMNFTANNLHVHQNKGMTKKLSYLAFIQFLQT